MSVRDWAVIAALMFVPIVGLLVLVEASRWRERRSARAWRKRMSSRWPS